MKRIQVSKESAVYAFTFPAFHACDVIHGEMWNEAEKFLSGSNFSYRDT